MRWLADECVDAGLVARLRVAGHDVLYMAEIAPAESDAEVLARAQRDGRLLLTEDKLVARMERSEMREGRPRISLRSIRATLAKRDRGGAMVLRFAPRVVRFRLGGPEPKSFGPNYTVIKTADAHGLAETEARSVG